MKIKTKRHYKVFLKQKRMSWFDCEHLNVGGLKIWGMIE